MSVYFSAVFHKIVVVIKSNSAFLDFRVLYKCYIIIIIIKKKYMKTLSQQSSLGPTHDRLCYCPEASHGTDTGKDPGTHHRTALAGWD